eukprot:jgi/Botrbrau1/16666/Bobra.0068s0082.1
MESFTLCVPTDECVVLEFPGYIKNDSKALEMFGGAQAIQKAMGQTATYLPLHLRPGDPLSHPIYGEKKKTKGILLKVCRPKRPDSDDSGASPSADTSEVYATVVGRVSTVIQFGGMADFQYVSQDPRPNLQQVHFKFS